MSATDAEGEGGWAGSRDRSNNFFKTGITTVQFRAFLCIFKRLKLVLMRSETTLLGPIPIVA